MTIKHPPFHPHQEFPHKRGCRNSLSLHSNLSSLFVPVYVRVGGSAVQEENLRPFEYKRRNFKNSYNSHICPMRNRISGICYFDCCKCAFRFADLLSVEQIKTIRDKRIRISLRFRNHNFYCICSSLVRCMAGH